MIGSNLFTPTGPYDKINTRASLAGHSKLQKLARKKRDKRIYTVGHSTHDDSTLIDLLKQQEITLLADVRRFPRSKRNPQFNIEQLRIALPKQGIEYIHFEDLGGRRKRSATTRNSGWRNASFQGYADYMGTVGFADALNELKKRESLERKTEGYVALMCAEALPWRCHRFLLSDALTASGYEVEHIFPSGKTMTHKMTPFAKIEKNGTVSLFYPASKTEK